MITKYEKANRGKLLVAVLAMAVVLAGAAVIFSDSEVNAEPGTDVQANTYTASQFLAYADTDKVINLGGDVTISDAVNLTGYTVNCKTNSITAKGNVTGGTITGSTDANANNCILTVGAKGITIDGTTFKITAGSDRSLPSAINTAEFGATVKGCTFECDEKFGAIHMNSDADSGVTLTVDGGDFGNGLIVYKGANLVIKSVDVKISFVALKGGVTDISTKNIKLEGSAKITESIIGWDKSTIPTKMESYEHAYNLKVENAIDLGAVSAGDAVPADEKPTLEILNKDATYTGATGVTVDKDNSDRTGISNNVVALEGDIIIDGEAYLVGEVTIPANKNVIIRNGGSLDLAGNNLILNGKLTIENRGSVIGTDGTEKIILKSGASIENNGALGSNVPVSVYANDADGTDDSYAMLQNVVGVSFGLIKSGNATSGYTYTLSVTGDVNRATGTTSSDDKVITLNKVTVNGDLTTSKDVTLAGEFTVARNGTVNADGPMTAIATLQYGATANINGAFTGTIKAQVEEGLSATGAGDSTHTYVTSDIESTGAAAVTGFTVTVDRTQYTDNNAVYYNQRAYVSGDIDTSVKEKEAVLSISGNVFVASGVTFTTSNYADIATTDTGLVIVDGTIVTSADPAFKFVGAYYEVTAEGERDATGYITSFDAAIKAIATADDNEIAIYGDNVTANADDKFMIDVTGTYTIEANQVVSSGNDVAALKIAESGKITVNDSAEFDAAAIAAIDGMVTVMYGGDCEPADNLYDVKSTNEAGDVTYAGLQVVLNNAQAGDEITVTGQKAEATTLTVPNGVTLNIEGKLTVQRSVTVAQGGELNLINGGELAIGDANNKPKKIAGTLTVNGTADITDGTLTMTGGSATAGEAKETVSSTGTLVYQDSNITGTTKGYVLNGAYYINDDSNKVLTTVPNAVAGALEADTVNVYVIGTVNDTTDVKLGGVALTVEGTATLGNIDVVDSKLEVTTGTLTATIIGQYGEDGATGTASIVLNKAKITGVNNTSTINAQNINEWTLTYTAITGNATISQGTVVANAITGNQESGKNTDNLTIASGATLLVKGTVEIKNYKAFNVEGTLDVANNSNLTLTGIDKMVVSGTMSVTGQASVADMIVTGTLDVTDSETAQGSMSVTGVLSVGEAAENLGATGTVNGPVRLVANAYVLAYPGTTVSLTSFGTEDNVESTQFYINGALYVTAYTLGDVLAIGTDAGDNGFMADVKITGFVTTDSTGSVINDVENWFSDAALETALVANNVTTFDIGDAEAAYIQLAPADAKIQYSVGSGISLYVDGIRVESGSTPVELSVGTHTVTATVNPGYTGDVTIQFNGQTVTGGTFEVTPEMAAETAGTFVLSATGNISVDTGSTGSSDDGMGLTEILLVILVILIVVMAIMVALRLMRS